MQRAGVRQPGAWATAVTRARPNAAPAAGPTRGGVPGARALRTPSQTATATTSAAPAARSLCRRGPGATRLRHDAPARLQQHAPDAWRGRVGGDGELGLALAHLLELHERRRLL